MKKAVICLLALGVLSCENQNDRPKEVINDNPKTPTIIDDTIENNNENLTSANEDISESDKQKVCSELKSWGTEDAYFEDNYLCYVVRKDNLSASAYEVGKAMFSLFEDINGLKGIKVISFETKKELGSYPE